MSFEIRFALSDNKMYRLKPSDDITPVEAAYLTEFFTLIAHGYSTTERREDYLNLHNLRRHFVLWEVPA